MTATPLFSVVYRWIQRCECFICSAACKPSGVFHQLGILQTSTNVEAPFSRAPPRISRRARCLRARHLMGGFLCQSASSVIYYHLSLSIFCFIILSGAAACQPRGRRYARRSRLPASPLNRTTFYVVLACFVVDLSCPHRLHCLAGRLTAQRPRKEPRGLVPNLTTSHRARTPARGTAPQA